MSRRPTTSPTPKHSAHHPVVVSKHESCADGISKGADLLLPKHELQEVGFPWKFPEISGNFRRSAVGGKGSAVGGRLRTAVGLPPPEVRFPWKFPESWFLSRGQISKRISRKMGLSQTGRLLTQKHTDTPHLVHRALPLLRESARIKGDKAGVRKQRPHATVASPPSVRRPRQRAPPPAAAAAAYGIHPPEPAQHMRRRHRTCVHRRARWRAAPAGNAKTHSTPPSHHDDGVEHK